MENIELDNLDSKILIVVSEMEKASTEGVYSRIRKITNRKYGSSIVLFRLMKLVEKGYLDIYHDNNENLYYRIKKDNSPHK